MAARSRYSVSAKGAGYAPIDWQKIEVEKYFDACKQGMMCNHDPLAKLLSKGLRRE